MLTKVEWTQIRCVQLVEWKSFNYMIALPIAKFTIRVTRVIFGWDFEVISCSQVCWVKSILIGNRINNKQLWAFDKKKKPKKIHWKIEAAIFSFFLQLIDFFLNGGIMITNIWLTRWFLWFSHGVALKKDAFPLGTEKFQTRLFSLSKSCNWVSFQ